MPSKKVRFDVFKRDGFVCQYCGRTPPEVVLEVDHINPKSKGGKDNINNYITACVDCNRGKAGTPLDKLPDGPRKNLRVLRETRAQLKAYNILVEEQEQDYLDAIDRINKIFKETYPTKIPTEQFNRTATRTFLTHLPEVAVRNAMAKACSFINDNPYSALKYYCGICWNRIKNPETRDW